MAALLTCDISGRNFKRKDALVEHLEDCQRMGVEVVPPDVNHSEAEFSVRDGKIHFGLAAIKGCGDTAADAIVGARKRRGSFRDLFDFCERVDAAACNHSCIETLIKAGAFDSLGKRRAQLHAVLDRAMQAGAAVLADRRSGQKSLFADLSDSAAADSGHVLPDVPEWSERERLLMEKEVLGFYLSSHPLAEHEATLARYCSHAIADIPALPDREEVVLGGMLSAITFRHVKNARPNAPTKYANFDLEDKSGILRCIVWPDAFAECGHLVQPDAILVVRGTIDRRGGGDEANLIVSELIPLSELESRYTTGIVIRFDETRQSADKLSSVREIIRGYPGPCEVRLVICLQDGSRVHLKLNNVHVEVTAELRDRLDQLLGPGNIRLITAKPAANGKHGGNGKYRRK
jgi:DNA polymerase-3 subunit alpha